MFDKVLNALLKTIVIKVIITVFIAVIRGVSRILSNIYNGVFYAKIVKGFWLFTIFKKALHHSCLIGS